MLKVGVACVHYWYC